MTSPLDPSLVRSAFLAFDTLADDAARLARTEAPGIFQRARARELDALADGILAATNDAARAAESLQLERSAEHAAALRQSVEGVDLLQASVADKVSMGRRVEAATIDARTALSMDVERHVDAELRTLLATPPRELAADDVEAIRSLLRVRDAGGVGHPGLGAELAADRLGSTPAELVASLHPSHMRATGIDADAAGARIRELVVGRARDVDAVDAAELRALIRVEQDALPQLPRELGTTRLDDLLARLVGDTATDADRRTLDVLVGAIDDDSDQATAIAREVLDHGPANLDPADLGTLSAILGRGGRTHHALTAGSSYDITGLRQLVDDGARGNLDAGLATELHVWRASLDGIASRTERVHDQVRTLLATSTDELDRDGWSRLRALDRIAGERHARPAHGLPDVDDALVGKAHGREPVTHDERRFVEAWRRHVSGEPLDADARDGELLRILDSDELPGPDDRARLHVLLDADGADGTDRLLRRLGDDVDAGAALAGDDPDLPRLLERWRLSRDGTIADPARADAAVDAILARPASQLGRRDWARLEALVDGMGGRNGITFGDDVAARDKVGVLARSGGEPDATVIGHLERWRTALDGTARDAQARAGAIHALVERDPSTLQGADWARLRALLDADQAGGTIAARIEDLPPADEVLGHLAGGAAPDATAHRYLAAWNASLDGLADDSDALHSAVARMLERDPNTFEAADWARLRAYADVDAATGHVGLRSTLDDGTAAVAALDAHVAGSRTLDSNMQRLLSDWQLRAERVADDPGRLRELIAGDLARDAGDIGADSWARMRTLLELDGAHAQSPLASQLAGTDDAATALERLAGGAKLDPVAARYVDLWRLQLDGPSTKDVASRLAAIARRESDSLSPEDWRDVRALLDLDEVEGTGRYARRLDGAVDADDVLASLVDGTRQVGGNARRYLASWRIEAEGIASSPRKLLGELRSAVAGEGPQTADDWARLRALHELDQQATSPRLTGALTHDPVVTELLEQLVDGDQSQLTSMQRYLKTWGYALDGTTASGEKTTAALGRLLSRPVEELSPDDWRSVRALVEGAAGQDELRLVRRLDAAEESGKVLAALSKAGAEAGRADRYAHVWRMQLDGSASDAGRLRGMLEPLLAKGIDQLDEDDLRTLVRVLDADQAGGALALARRIDDMDSPARLVAGRVADITGDASALERYARTWSMQLDGSAHDRATLAARLDELVATARAGELDEEGRIALRTLLDVDEATGTLGLARSVGRLPSIHDVLKPGSIDPEALGRYADVWRQQLDGVASDRSRIAPLLQRIVARDSGDMSADDLVRLRHLYDTAATGDGIRLSGSLAGSKDAPEVLDAAVTSAAGSAELDRYLHAWRLQVDGTADDRAAMATRLLDVLEHGGDRLSVDDARTLRAIVDADRAAGTLGLRTRIDGLGAGDALVAKGGSTDGLDMSGQVLRYTSAWELQARGILGDAAASRAELVSLLDRDPAVIGARDWARAAALLDPDGGGRAIGLTRELDGYPAAYELATNAAGGTTDAAATRAYAANWRYQVDGTLTDANAFRTELARLLDVPRDSRTLEDWSRMLALVDADRHYRHVGLTPEPIGLTRSQLRSALGKGDTANEAADGLTRLWKLELDGTTRDAGRLRSLVDEITRGPASTASRQDWMVMRHVLDLDAATGVLGLSRGNHVVNAQMMAIGDADEINAGARQLAFGQWRADIGTGYALSEAQALHDGRLATHMIRRADVDGFLADSKLRQTVFHGSTNAETHAHIIEKGPLVDKNKRSMFGRGFYTATEPGGWGDDVVEVAVRSRRPFVTTNAAGVKAWVTSKGGGDFRDVLLRNGYDSILVRNGDGVGGDWVIALRDEDVKVVVEDAAGVFDRRGVLPTKFDRSSIT